jgi:hypothetical protein
MIWVRAPLIQSPPHIHIFKTYESFGEHFISKPQIYWSFETAIRQRSHCDWEVPKVERMPGSFKGWWKFLLPQSIRVYKGVCISKKQNKNSLRSILKICALCYLCVVTFFKFKIQVNQTGLQRNSLQCSTTHYPPFPNPKWTETEGELLEAWNR